MITTFTPEPLPADLSAGVGILPLDGVPVTLGRVPFVPGLATIVAVPVPDVCEMPPGPLVDRADDEIRQFLELCNAPSNWEEARLSARLFLLETMYVMISQQELATLYGRGPLPPGVHFMSVDEARRLAAATLLLESA